jgi:hypothetical protein
MIFILEWMNKRKIKQRKEKIAIFLNLNAKK